MKILFLHGLEGKPTGSKVAHLIGDHFIMAPRLPKEDFPESLRIARNALAAEPDLIVGSSRGGAVAMALETEIPRILIAPAWNHFGVDLKKLGLTNSYELILFAVRWIESGKTV